MAKDTPALPRSFAAAPKDPRIDQLRAERRELAHWLRLITAKRDLIAARVVPPLGDFQVSTTAHDLDINKEVLTSVLDLNAPLPSNDDLRLLQKCAAQAAQRIAELDDQIQAW